MLSSVADRLNTGLSLVWSLIGTMASPTANSEPQSESFTSGETRLSLTGGVIAPRPEPGDFRARLVAVSPRSLYVELVDGRSLSVPLEWFPRLIEASPRERAEYQLVGDGTLIHWPAVDEDIDVANLFR